MIDLNEDRAARIIVASNLADISIHLRRIETIIAKGFDNFVEDEDAQDAIISRIAAIGENLKRITERSSQEDKFGLINEFPKIRWTDLKSMRNFIAHNYAETNLYYVWDAVNSEVPKIKEMVKNICNKFENIEEAIIDRIEMLEFNRKEAIEKIKALYNKNETPFQNKSPKPNKPRP